MELTEKEQKRLKELGWIDIEKKMLPLGEKVNVMRLVSRGHQQLWQQSFNSVAEVFASGVTHWAKEVTNDNEMV